jgi:hypothetical protein
VRRTAYALITNFETVSNRQAGIVKIEYGNLSVIAMTVITLGVPYLFFESAFIWLVFSSSSGWSFCQRLVLPSLEA